MSYDKFYTLIKQYRRVINSAKKRSARNTVPFFFIYVKKCLRIYDLTGAKTGYVGLTPTKTTMMFHPDIDEVTWTLLYTSVTSSLRAAKALLWDAHFHTPLFPSQARRVGTFSVPSY